MKLEGLRSEFHHWCDEKYRETASQHHSSPSVSSFLSLCFYMWMSLRHDWGFYSYHTVTTKKHNHFTCEWSKHFSIFIYLSWIKINISHLSLAPKCPVCNSKLNSMCMKSDQCSSTWWPAGVSIMKIYFEILWRFIESFLLESLCGLEESLRSFQWF